MMGMGIGHGKPLSDSGPAARGHGNETLSTAQYSLIDGAIADPMSLNGHTHRLVLQILVSALSSGHIAEGSESAVRSIITCGSCHKEPTSNCMAAGAELRLDS